VACKSRGREAERDTEGNREREKERERHSPTVGSWGEVVSYERGTPVWFDMILEIFLNCEDLEEEAADLARREPARPLLPVRLRAPHHKTVIYQTIIIRQSPIITSSFRGGRRMF